MQVSCKTLILEGNEQSPDNLEVSLPENDFDLEFIEAYKQIKQQHYYFESSRWINKNKNLDVYVAYTYLLGNYIYVNEPHLLDIVKEAFEDRVISSGNIKNLTRLVNEFPKKEEVTSIIPFKLEDAECLYFRRFLKFNSNSYNAIEGGASIFDIDGDARLTGYVCDYGATIADNDDIEKFIWDIKVGSVLVMPHIEELKKMNADEKN